VRRGKRKGRKKEKEGKRVEMRERCVSDAGEGPDLPAVFSCDGKTSYLWML